MHRPRQDGGTRKRHAQCLSRTLRNGKPQMRRKPWMMPVLWKWPVPVSGLWPVFRSASQWQSRRCRRRNRFKRYGKGMILLDIGKCVAVRIFRHRQIQAVHRELREPEAFVCRVGNGFSSPRETSPPSDTEPCSAAEVETVNRYGTRVR